MVCVYSVNGACFFLHNSNLLVCDDGEGEAISIVDCDEKPWSMFGDPDWGGSGLLHSEELADAVLGWTCKLLGVNWLIVDCITLNASKVDEKGSPSASCINLDIWSNITGSSEMRAMASYKAVVHIHKERLQA